MKAGLLVGKLVVLLVVLLVVGLVYGTVELSEFLKGNYVADLMDKN